MDASPLTLTCSSLSKHTLQYFPQMLSKNLQLPMVKKKVYSFWLADHHSRGALGTLKILT